MNVSARFVSNTAVAPSNITRNDASNPSVLETAHETVAVTTLSG